MDQPRVVSRNDWLAARRELLEQEKQLTRQRDAVNEQRRRLPMVRVDKEYVFDTPSGRKRLADLFDGRSQLIVYHFMFGPDWQEGCRSCSFLADHIDGTLVHLAHRDVTFTAVSRAPLAHLETFKQRMGWRFQWVSSAPSDFNFDFHVSFAPEEQAKGRVYYNYDMMEFPSEEAHGASVFYKNDAGEVFHTYSSYARGCDVLVGTYNYLDFVPKGRDEAELPWTMAWVRHHDRYDDEVFP